MSTQLVKVKRDRILACITCPLCHKLFRDATTISECLHTFCRKCIYKKLSDEELESCPVCNIDLGGVSIEKLRPDHNLEDVRAKMFPYKRRKVEAPVIVPSVTLPVRRKEMSLSSLVVSTPRVSAQTGMTGRRSKSSARKALQGSTFSVDKPIKNVEDSGEEPDSSSSPETLKVFTQNERLNSSNAKPSSHPTPDRDTNNCADPREGKVHLGTGSKCSRFTSEGCIGKSKIRHFHGSEGHVRKTEVKEHIHKLEVENDNNKCGPAPLESEKPKKLRIIRGKKASTFGELGISPQTVQNSVSVKCQRRTNPIWFSLVASEDQQGDAPLPQISASYLRIKDGNIPVSFIQRYLMRKLDLSSEDEVEIRCMGQLIVPTQQVNNLVDIWLRTTESEIVPAVVGSSAKDFLMVLAYARKISTCPRLSLYLHELGKASSEIPATTSSRLISIPEDMNLLTDIRAHEVFSDLVGPLESAALQGLTTEDLATAEVVGLIKGLVHSVFCYQKRRVEREELDKLKEENFCLTKELAITRNLLEAYKRELTRLGEQKVVAVAQVSVLEADIAQFCLQLDELERRRAEEVERLNDASRRAGERAKAAEADSVRNRERAAELSRDLTTSVQRVQELESQNVSLTEDASRRKMEVEELHEQEKRILRWAPVEAHHEFLKKYDADTFKRTFKFEKEKARFALLVKKARRDAGYASDSDVEDEDTGDESSSEDGGSGTIEETSGAVSPSTLG